MKIAMVDKEYLFGSIIYQRAGDVVGVSVFGKTVYQRVGDVACCTLLGFNVYERVGSVKSLFGVKYGH